MSDFLTPVDYNSQIREEVKTIIAGNDAILHDAELKAQSRVESYLHQRYDVPKIFIPTNEYDNGKQYDEGEQAWYDDSGTKKIYTAKQSTTGNLPTNTTYWEQKDQRHKYLVQIVVDLTLYILHYANSPRAVPAHVEKQHDEAIRWLEMVNASKLNPGLPVIDEDPGNPVQWTNDAKKDDPYW